MNSTAGKVERLNPFTEYTCTIFAFTVLPGPTGDPITVITAQQSGITDSNSYSNYNSYHYL